ncbi:MAG: response regulator transcription factor [Chloroflexi bacterium]|nr:MAG: response regulator transcription factor [Chloroflexota bacterium]
MKTKAAILLVNRNQRNLELLAEFLGKGGYALSTASSLEEFDQALAEENDVGVALVDITGFDQSIWERCEQLRSRKKPFLVVSPRQSAAIQQASLSHGAKGVMIKPLVVQELMGLVKSMLEEQE